MEKLEIRQKKTMVKMTNKTTLNTKLTSAPQFKVVIVFKLWVPKTNVWKTQLYTPQTQ